MRLVRAVPLVLALSAVVGAGLAVGQAPHSSHHRARHVAAESVDDRVDRVLLVSVDGLNPDAVVSLGARRAPTFHRLLREGASTLNARTLREETETLPNHASMLTGRRAALPGGTGVRVDHDPGTTLRRTAREYVAGVFDVVHDHGGRTSMYVAKSKFRFFNRSWNRRHGARDRAGRHNGRDKIDRFVYREAREGRLVTRLAAELARDPHRLTFLHLAGPDRAGHRYGGMSPAYLDAVERTDRLLGRLLATVDSHRRLRRHLLVILTADHGTDGYHHSATGHPANYRIPFFAWGPGVATGADLYELNPELRPPGSVQPAYSATPPVRNADAANLVMDVLDLPRVPGSRFDRLMTLDLG